MKWACAATLTGVGGVGAALLLMRFASGDPIFFANPVVVGGLLIGIIVTSGIAATAPAGSRSVWVLPVSLAALLMAAAVGVASHAAFAVALTSALRMPLLAGFGLTILSAARGSGWRIPPWISIAIGAAAAGGFLAILLFAPQQTPFGDIPPRVDVAPALVPSIAVIGILLVQLATATLVLVPAGIWWAVLRSDPERRRQRLALAAVSSIPVPLCAVALLLATWRGDSDSPAAAAWLAGGLSAAAVALGARLTTSLPATAMPGQSLDTLTHRENEVLALLADGHTNQAIADRLVVSKRTVDAHVRSLFAKLGVAGVGNPRVRAADVWRRHLHN